MTKRFLWRNPKIYIIILINLLIEKKKFGVILKVHFYAQNVIQCGPV